MTDGRCTVCPAYGRDAGRAKSNPVDPGWVACRSCQARMGRHLADIPVQYGLLDAAPGGAPGGSRVTGSREQPLGVRVAVLDLIVPASIGAVRDVAGDQIGTVPTAATLDAWASDWRDLRDQRETRPVPTVTVLAQWLANRLDWACRYHPALADFAGEIRRLMGALYAANGDTAATAEHKAGVPCSRCDMMTLVRAPGDGYIECTSCGTLLTPDEYDRWTGLVRGQLTPEQITTITPAKQVVDIPSQRETPEDIMITGYKGPAVLVIDQTTRLDVQADLASKREKESGIWQWSGTLTLPNPGWNWPDNCDLELPGRTTGRITALGFTQCGADVGELVVHGHGAAPYAVDAFPEQRKAA